MRSLARTLPAAGLFALFALASGCDSSAPAMGDYVDVKGTVTAADGKPVKLTTIYFEPVTPGQGRDQFVEVKDGAFELKMFTAKYKVAFDTESKRPAVPSKYTKFDSSGLTADVKGGMSPLTFELK